MLRSFSAIQHFLSSSPATPESIFVKCLMECDRNAISALNSTSNKNEASLYTLISVYWFHSTIDTHKIFIFSLQLNVSSAVELVSLNETHFRKPSLRTLSFRLLDKICTIHNRISSYILSYSFAAHLELSSCTLFNKNPEL